MNNIKIKVFVKLKFDKHNCFDYGGFYIGEGTPYKIVAINFNKQYITVHEPSWIDYMPYSIDTELDRNISGFCGYTTNNYPFEDVEIIDCNIEGEKLTEEIIQGMIEIADRELEELRK